MTKESRGSCKDFEWMVSPLVDGELPSAEAVLVESHLRDCPACQRLAEDFRSMDRIAKRVDPPPAVTESEWSRMEEAVRREPKGAIVELRRSALDWLLPVISLAAILLIGAWVAFQVFHQEAEGDRIIQIPGQEEHPAIPVAPKPGERR